MWLQFGGGVFADSKNLLANFLSDIRDTHTAYGILQSERGLLYIKVY